MKLKKLGIIQIILAAIIILAEFEIHNVFRFLTWSSISIIYNPMVIIAIIMIIIGIKFIKSNQEINFHIDALLSKIKLKNLPKKHIGTISLILGILMFIISAYKAEFFTHFSGYTLVAMIFDDAKIPFTTLVVFLTILGIYIIVKNKSPKLSN